MKSYPLLRSQLLVVGGGRHIFSEMLSLETTHFLVVSAFMDVAGSIPMNTQAVPIVLSQLKGESKHAKFGGK